MSINEYNVGRFLLDDGLVYFKKNGCIRRYYKHACPIIHGVKVPGFLTDYNILEIFSEKVQVGKDQKKAQSENDSHSKKPRWEKTKLTIRYMFLYHENIS